MKTTLIAAFACLLLAFPLFLGSCAKPDTPVVKGYLTGQVTIGPLCPVEPCNPDSTMVRQAYLTRKIIVVNQETKISREIFIDSTGQYATALPPGIYSIAIKKNGMDRASLPEAVIITANETTRVDISIDTGLR
jgi:hypothetical protein